MSIIPIVPAPSTGPSFVINSAYIRELTGTVISGNINTVGVLNVKTDAPHSLNAMVELVYVRVGNEIMGKALSKLENALSATSTTLDALTSLQQLQNQIAVGAKSAIPFNFKDTNQVITYTTTIPDVISEAGNTNITFTRSAEVTRRLTNIEEYQSGYNIIAEQYYKPIDPYFSITQPQQSAVAITALNSAQLAADSKQKEAYDFFVKELGATRARISALLPQLSALLPPGGVNDPTTLYAKLTKIYSHLPKAGASFASTKAWALDGYTVHGSSAVINAGLLQQEVTNAIVAGESLNTNQQAAVRKYMFIFEQYYTSATSILSQLHQLISSIARKLTQ